MGGSGAVRLDLEGRHRVPEENQPLLLLVSELELGLLSIRSRLRAAGYLVASGRSVDAAISLLDQVRVDGCVVMGSVSVTDARRLALSLDRYNPGCPKMLVQEAGLLAPDPWRGCELEGLLSALQEAFSRC